MDYLDLPLNLLSQDGYFAFWHGVRSGVNSGFEAWQIVEDVAMRRHGVNIYDEYSKFSDAKWLYSKTVPQKSAYVLTKKGYFEKYNELRDGYNTDKEAYEALEEFIFDEWGKRMNPTYHAFIVDRSRYYKKKKKPVLYRNKWG